MKGWGFSDPTLRLIAWAQNWFKSAKDRSMMIVGRPDAFNCNQVPPAPPNHDVSAWESNHNEYGAIRMRQSIQIGSHCRGLEGCLALC